MKRKEAIKLIRKGKIQIENDLIPSTKQIKKFLKEAFPKDEFLQNNPNTDLCKENYFYKYSRKKWSYSNYEIEDLPTVKLSAITKNKETKLSQLEDQFSELAKERLNNDIELIVGEWYKSKTSGSIALFSKDEFLKGFTWYGIWVENVIQRKNIINEKYRSFWTKATPQELQNALENEARKRGFEERNIKIVNFKCIYNILTKEYYLSDDLKRLYYNGVCVFKDGIWAEIKEEIDWSVPQLVISDKGNVVATNGNNSEDAFEGIVVFSDNLLHPVNLFSKFWGKEFFKPFKGELIIKQKNNEIN